MKHLLLAAAGASMSLAAAAADFGLISIPVASMRTAGAHSAEMSTQAVMGTPVEPVSYTHLTLPTT